MSDDQTRLQYLYDRFISDEASPEEVREFWKLFQKEGDDSIRESAFELYEDNLPEEFEGKNWSDASERIFNHGSKKTVVRMNAKWYAAASILLLLGISGYFFFGDKNVSAENSQPATSATIAHDVAAPAGSQATITLANGETIFLDSASSGRLAMQNDVSLIKTEDGKIKYATGKDEVDGQMIFNTLTNPVGSKVVDMILSDGSHVWLNSGSSVTYPVVFSGKERRLSMIGEAYFEVSHDASRKFMVESNGVTTEVLGTHFNINSYPDEDDIRVTLFEGSVKVAVKNGKSATIKPGEQAVKSTRGQLTTRNDVYLDGVIAWKNAMFNFHDTNIKEIMREIARWYDVDIHYGGGEHSFEGLNFGGSMSRQKNVSELLKRLEATRSVRFEINGRKINVIRVI